MEPKNMHAHVAGATPVAPLSPAPPVQPLESSPFLGPDTPMEPSAADILTTTPETALSTEDSPEVQEIKEELAHLDEIDATLPPHEDDGDDGGEAEHHAGAPHHKKRRHR